MHGASRVRTRSGSARRRGQPETILEDSSNLLLRQLSQHPLVEPSLRLSGREITWLPKQLFQLSYIENLYLSENLIEILPERFFEKLPMIKYLDLRSNQLTELPSRGMKKHLNLEYLLVSNNKIKRLPKELGEIDSLKAVSWHSNPLEYPSKEVLKQGTDELKASMRADSIQENKQKVVLS